MRPQWLEDSPRKNQNGDSIPKKKSCYFRAPGKMVIAGEYAVLEGHPAIVAAVDRYVEFTVEPAQELCVSALGLKKCTLQYDQRGTPSFTGYKSRLSLAEAVFQIAHKRGIPMPKIHISMESSQLSLKLEHKAKLGLGSSAAVASGLTRIILGRKASKKEIFRHALQAHLQFSKGKGSGIDVAASTYGGLVYYQNRIPKTAPALPKEISIIPVYVGHSQSTRIFLQALQRLKKSKNSTYFTGIQQIADSTEDFIQSLKDKDSQKLLSAVGKAYKAMANLGHIADIPIISPPHQKVSQITRAFGGAAKPSGAGGGDIALAFIERSKKTQLMQALSDLDFYVLDEYNFNAQGVSTFAKKN